MKVNLSHYENQLVLYSKGHFHTEDTFEDVKKITAKAFGLPPEYTDFRNVYHFVGSTYFTLVEMGFIKTSVKDFFLSLYKFPNDVLTANELVKKLLIEISLIEVADLDLGDIDTGILPERKKVVYELRIVRLKDEDDSFIIHGEQSKVEAYMEHIYKVQEDDIVSESPTYYPTTEQLYKDLDIVGEDNPSLEVYDAHAYVVN